MLSIYLFFLTVKFSATFGCAITSWLIARKRMTPTGTYMLFCAAFVIALGTQAYSLTEIRPIITFLSGFDVSKIVITQIFSSSVFLLLLTGLVRKLAALKATGIK